jgi:hypothetical protein
MGCVALGSAGKNISPNGMEVYTEAPRDASAGDVVTLSEGVIAGQWSNAADTRAMARDSR